MRALGRAVLPAALLTLVGASVVAHVRLRHSSNGNPLFWSNPTNIGIVISSAGSDDLPDGSHETAVRLAIADWNAVTGTTARLVEDTDPVEQARLDYGSSSIHLVLWDETNSTPYLPPGSGIVAVTPIFFQSSGQITDADVIFNGGDYTFGTAGQGFAFDVQGVAAHELGHLLGLDHSGWAGSTLYPYVSTGQLLQRSLTGDEVHGLRNTALAGGLGSLVGEVRRAADDTPVEGACVVARGADGRPAASVFTLSDGSFTLAGLDPDTYTVYATPFDVPVSTAHLGSWYAGHVDTDFEPAFYGPTGLIVASEQVDLGTLLVGADVSLNLGSLSDTYPKQAIAGTVGAYTIRGSGLTGGTLSVSDPTLTITGVSWQTSRVVFNLSVPGGEPAGNVDVQVVNLSGELALLPAAIEVTPVAPTVASIVPNIGSSAGGTAVTISGTGFLAGARVVLGDQVYLDQPGGLTVVNSTTITLATSATVAGLHDVVVLDGSGLEGRLTNGFTVPSSPVLSTVFPSAGTTAGGTPLSLAGTGFLPGATVLIDGVLQASVSYVDPTRLDVDTNPAAEGGPYTVDVMNPDGALSSLAFAYSYAGPPDPALATVTPSSGGTGGGATVTLVGSDFPASSQVLFGVDPDTGAGGTPAASVTWIDASTLSVVTPAHAGGFAAVLVRNPTTGQACVLASAYEFRGGGGGGGCFAVRPGGTPTPPTLRDTLASSAWMLLLLFATVAARRSGRRRVAAA